MRSHALHARCATLGRHAVSRSPVAQIVFPFVPPSFQVLRSAMATFPEFAKYGIKDEDLAKLHTLGLEGPADLAFAFTCLEQAAALGVGAAWTAVRRDAKAFAHTACVQWRGCKPSTVHGQSGKVTPASKVTLKAR